MVGDKSRQNEANDDWGRFMGDPSGFARTQKRAAESQYEAKKGERPGESGDMQ